MDLLTALDQETRISDTEKLRLLEKVYNQFKNPTSDEKETFVNSFVTVLSAKRKLTAVNEKSSSIIKLKEFISKYNKQCVDIIGSRSTSSVTLGYSSLFQGLTSSTKLDLGRGTELSTIKQNK